MLRHNFSRLFVVKVQKTKGAKMKTEIYVSIKDMVAECIKKVWIIVIFMIIFAILVAGYKYKKDLIEIDSTIKQEEKNVDKLLESLSPADYNAVKSYVGFYKYVAQQQEYSNNSVILNLDPYNVNVATLQFYVQATDESSNDDAVVAYLSYIDGGAVAEDMYELDKEIPVSDVDALITCEATGPVSLKATDMPENTNVITVNVYGQSEKQCKTLVTNLKQCVEAYSTKLNQYAVNTISLVNESYSVQSSNYLIITKADRLNNITLWNTKLLEEQKRLGDANVAIAEQMISIEENGNQQQEVEKANKTVAISKKYIVMGGAVGIILATFIIALNYILNGRLKTEKELQMMYGVRNLGSIAETEGKFFENLADKICNHGNVARGELVTGELVVSQIVNICENMEIKEISIVGPQSIKEKLEDKGIIERLDKRGISAKYIGDVSRDADAVSSLNINKKVIMVETARQSYYVDIETRVNRIKNQGIDILGYVTII